MRRAPAALLPALLLAGCAGTPPPDPTYRPTESALEVLAVLRLHVDDDTYRFPPARDFTGKNVYYASLLRLERLEEIHAGKFRSGYLLGPVLFAKGRALERMGEYALAARHYARVAELDPELAAPARRGRDACEQLETARALEPGPEDAVERALATFDARAAALESLERAPPDPHYRHVAREEIERTDRARAEYFDARRRLDPSLDTLALQQYQRLVQRHPESKHRNRNLLDLADAYASLSRGYATRYPPTSLGFDPVTFDEYAYGATRLYEAVARQDGALEKIEAARKLEAYLAFTLQVHDEKLPRGP